MKFRKLRIAWSVFWGIACVLLIVLWVRSYWQLDEFVCYAKHFRIASLRGQLLINHHFISIHSKGAPDFTTHDVFGNSIIHNSFPMGSAERDIRGIEIPLLFPTLLIGAIGAIPWLAYRFSLRTLLIATTLVAVVLGLVVYSSTH